MEPTITTTTSLNGFRVDAELVNVPAAFVNALRRIALSEIPTVVMTNIQILDNTSQLTHEMIRHRVEMMPINVRPEEGDVIRDTKIEVRYLPGSKEPRDITSNDFVVAGPRSDVILVDRDSADPLYFMTLNPNESLHIKATLAVDTEWASQVCVSTFKNHIDPGRAKADRDSYILGEGTDPRVFDNFYIQRSFSVDEKGRPNHFDLAIESVGTMQAVDILRKSIEILKAKIVEWAKTPILRESDGFFRVETQTEGHTVGNLVQYLIYEGGLAEYASYHIEHPLVPTMIVRFQTKTVQPDAVIDKCREQAVALCESILKSV
jgi:DNA-directed RNA polymerase subunit L